MTGRAARHSRLRLAPVIAGCAFATVSLGGCWTSSSDGTSVPSRPPSPTAPVPPLPAPDRSPTSPAATEAPPTSLGPPPSRQLSELEQRGLAQLDRLGVRGGVVEHGFRDAWVGGPWHGQELILHLYPPSVPHTPGREIAHDVVTGRQVTYLQTVGFGVIGRFTCGSLFYAVAVLPAGRPEATYEGTADGVRAVLSVVTCRGGG